MLKMKYCRPVQEVLDLVDVFKPLQILFQNSKFVSWSALTLLFETSLREQAIISAKGPS